MAGLPQLAQVERTLARPARVARPGILSFRRLWFPAALLVVGLYAGLPWLAPVFMRLGWTGPAQTIYDIYSTQCHQLAQRSYFLFGSKIMYSPSELEIADAAAGFSSLRAYRGAPGIGWKVAWSDRMAAMYTGLFVFLIGARLLRRRLSPLPVWALMVLLLPLALDGTTHFLSDLAGFGQGFRDSNLWLASLTGSRFAPGFYAGDAWGSFNAGMRLLSGVLFGLAVAWFSVPRLDSYLEGNLLRSGPTSVGSAAAAEV
jgi:uncharacterized membrane protein